MKTCIVIPTFNHGSTLDTLLTRLAPYKLLCIVVDDGSDDLTKAQLKTACDKFGHAHLLTLDYNRGKGGAVLAGLHYAKRHDFTHALQIDADGQHNTDDIKTFLQASKKNPSALIAGTPVYDHSVPKSRLYGRRITNFWVAIETLSRQIKDAMCGFRIYPIEQTLKLDEQTTIARGMAFDIDIIVRFAWQGTQIESIPTHVTYPDQGISHFNLWKDNARISWTHTKLFFGMLRRLPRLISRQNSKLHWASIQEVGSLIGMRSMLMCYRILGKRATYYLLYPLITYFYATNSAARNASKQYLANLQQHANGEKLSSFKHFLSFSRSIVDKFSVWNSDIKTDQIDFPNKQLITNSLAKKQGGVIITAHLGNIEIARALSQFEPDIKVNAIVFHKNAVKINHILNKINPDFSLNLIEVQNLNIQLAIELQEKIDAGEFIVIVADRTSTTKAHRTLKANFLGHDAYFPQGSFILAGLLACPVYFMLCLKQDKNHYKLILEQFAESMDIKNPNRDIKLHAYAQQYADLLTTYCQQYPLQWYNFFNFWTEQYQYET